MTITDAALDRGRTSTSPAPRRWAARSAATWRTGSPRTPTASRRSSRTPACGTSTRSPGRPTSPPSGTRVRRPAREAGAVPGELAAPARREHPHPDAGHPRRQGLPGPHRRGAAALVRPGAVLRAGEVPLLPGREPLDPHARARARSGTKPSPRSSPSMCSARSGAAPTWSDPGPFRAGNIGLISRAGVVSLLSVSRRSNSGGASWSPTPGDFSACLGRRRPSDRSRSACVTGTRSTAGPLLRTSGCRPAGAWTAVSPSVTPAARSAT